MRSKRTPLPKVEPLFVEFLNCSVSKEYILSFLVRLEKLFTDKEDKKSVKEFREEFKDHHLEGYRLIQTKFRDQVDYVISNQTFDSDFASWANFYLSALREIRHEDKSGNEERIVQIGDPNGDWITGLILYNFSLFCKYYGIDLLRNCPVCRMYFSIHPTYYEYCSKTCKGKKEK